jgi:hypothetical protein
MERLPITVTNCHGFLSNLQQRLCLDHEAALWDGLVSVGGLVCGGRPGGGAESGQAPAQRCAPGAGAALQAPPSGLQGVPADQLPSV